MNPGKKIYPAQPAAFGKFSIQLCSIQHMYAESLFHSKECLVCQGCKRAPSRLWTIHIKKFSVIITFVPKISLIHKLERGLIYMTKLFEKFLEPILRIFCIWFPAEFCCSKHSTHSFSLSLDKIGTD